MHASEQQIVVIKSEQQNLIEIPDFLSTTEGCPLLRRALLRALSVFSLNWWSNLKNNQTDNVKVEWKILPLYFAIFWPK